MVFLLINFKCFEHHSSSFSRPVFSNQGFPNFFALAYFIKMKPKSRYPNEINAFKWTLFTVTSTKKKQKPKTNFYRFFIISTWFAWERMKKIK